MEKQRVDSIADGVEAYTELGYIPTPNVDPALKAKGAVYLYLPFDDHEHWNCVNVVIWESLEILGVFYSEEY